MHQTQTTSSLTSSELASSLELIEVKPGVRFDLQSLRSFLPDVPTALFFGKVYALDAQQLGVLLARVLNTDLAHALFTGSDSHSTSLQDYLVDGWTDEAGVFHPGIVSPVDRGKVTFDAEAPEGEILPHVWKDLEVVVANSIMEVAAKLESVVRKLPSKEGSMVFQTMRKMNLRRPTIGQYLPTVKHEQVTDNLLILDVSGSMSEQTVRAIVDDVVALSYTASASMATVSDACTYWEPGSYSTQDVLDAATYGGTHYETLAPLFDGRDWGTVITVADYDSARSAAQFLKNCTGRIEQVVDVSLVNRPTYLAECVGQLARDVKPVLIGSSRYVLS